MLPHIFNFIRTVYTKAAGRVVYIFKMWHKTDLTSQLPILCETITDAVSDKDEFAVHFVFV